MLPPVTPCVGVWIEIFVIRIRSILSRSLPAWECGLKCGGRIGSPVPHPSLPAWECGLKSEKLTVFFIRRRVTPCVGVWIEISAKTSLLFICAVTPCVGVWIEMSPSLSSRRRPAPSLPAWECGLKLNISALPPSGSCHSLRGSVD